MLYKFGAFSSTEADRSLELVKDAGMAIASSKKFSAEALGESETQKIFFSQDVVL